MIKLISFFLLFIQLNQIAFAKRVNILHMGRKFVLVVPEDSSPGPKPLLVLLHGCLQDADIILKGTRLEDEALKNNFFILAPEQPKHYNIDNCWNWFMPTEQFRFHANEMGQIVTSLDVVAKKFSIDKKKIFLAGLSAGGALAHNLSSCYPDVFAGSAIHSGINFKAAESLIEARPVMTARNQKSPAYLAQKMKWCSGSVKHHLSKMIIIHGEADRSVLPLHADLISDTTSVWRDERGTVTVQNLEFPNGYVVERTDTQYFDFLERKLIVKGLPHAWGGGRDLSVYFDSKAPSSTKFILEFFSLVNKR